MCIFIFKFIGERGFWDSYKELTDEPSAVSIMAINNF
jgi:hypothetical protein